ncbi:MAG: hypothetical protein ACAH80_00645 [Alphaproteobacteria bacterium]
MILPPDLLKVIEKGIEARDDKTLPRPKMHIAIAGPPKSGRYTLASDYCAELGSEDIKPEVMAMLSIKYLDGLSGERLDEIFRMARDSMLVIRDMSRSGPRTAEVDERIEKALQQEGPPIIVMIGSEKYLKKLLKKIQPAGAPVPLIMTARSFTPEERAAFDRSAHDEQLAAERQERRQARADEKLRQLMDVKTSHPVEVKKPLRIIKPPRP